ncbi:hypothetical protein PSTT_10815 [Puccinia striiformis]|uniref:CCHC-type domain-containing protein n=1 Tax=Puccinia striiformis TaxID=27350 RepID=A0A2S4V2W0_9BASI|nr:hypothetical protein PSTT_10815 [Puccinia striiformis]
MGAHLRNGGNISIEQHQLDLEQRQRAQPGTPGSSASGRKREFRLSPAAQQLRESWRANVLNRGPDATRETLPSAGSSSGFNSGRGTLDQSGELDADHYDAGDESTTDRRQREFAAQYDYQNQPSGQRSLNPSNHDHLDAAAAYPQRECYRGVRRRDGSSSSTETLRGAVRDVASSTRLQLHGSTERRVEPSDHHSGYDPIDEDGSRDRRALPGMESVTGPSRVGSTGNHWYHGQRSRDGYAPHKIPPYSDSDHGGPGDKSRDSRATTSPTRDQSVPGAWPTSAPRAPRPTTAATTATSIQRFPERRVDVAASAGKPFPPPESGSSASISAPSTALPSPSGTSISSAAPTYVQSGAASSATIPSTTQQSPPSPSAARQSSSAARQTSYEAKGLSRPTHQSSRSQQLHDANGRRRRTNAEKGKTRQSTPSRPSLDSDDHFSPVLFDFDDLSSPSNKEFLLNNVNNDFSRDAPFLLEDRLKDLFSSFLSEMTNAVQSMPTSLLETSIQDFSAVVCSEMREIVTTEIIPTMLESALTCISDVARDKQIPEYREHFLAFENKFAEKVTSIQDTIYEIDNNTIAGLLSLKQRFNDFDSDTHKRFTAMNDKPNDAIQQDDSRAERVNRKLNDISATINNMNYKLSQFVSSPSTGARDTPPHIVEPPAAPANVATVSFAAPRNTEAPERRENNRVTTASVGGYALLDHGTLDVDLRRELWRGIHKSSDWEVFTGEMPYNHELWIQHIDVFANDYMMSDAMVISRLSACLTKTAKSWYISAKVGNDGKPWSWWKERFRHKFGTHNWKLKMRSDFESDRFHLGNPKVHDWFNTQRERLRAFYPELSEYLVCAKLLDQCPKQLIHAVKSRFKKDDTELTYEELVIIVEDIVSNPTAQYRPSLHQPTNRSNWKDNSQTKRPDAAKAEGDIKKTSTASPAPPFNKTSVICNACKQPGHYSRECPKRKTRVNNIDLDQQEEGVDSHNEEDDANDSPGSYDGDQDIPPDSFIGVIEHGDGERHSLDLPIFAIECDVCPSLSIADVQAAAHQPQQWDDSLKVSHVEDARLMKCKPDQGKAHLTGRANLTAVLINESSFLCLLDSGASCSVVSQQLLDKIKPTWKDSLLPINHAQFHSCSDKLEAMGVIELPLIFPHTKGSVRLQAEFVVMKNARIRYLILGNDYLHLYGFDITNSKERFFTIGNENKRKKFSFRDTLATPTPVTSEVAIVTPAPSTVQAFVDGDLSDAHISDKLSVDERQG